MWTKREDGAHIHSRLSCTEPTLGYVAAQVAQDSGDTRALGSCPVGMGGDRLGSWAGLHSRSILSFLRGPWGEPWTASLSQLYSPVQSLVTVLTNPDGPRGLSGPLRKPQSRAGFFLSTQLLPLSSLRKQLGPPGALRPLACAGHITASLSDNLGWSRSCEDKLLGLASRKLPQSGSLSISLPDFFYSLEQGYNGWSCISHLGPGAAWWSREMREAWGPEEQAPRRANHSLPPDCICMRASMLTSLQF